ncbi:hypothetical protein NMG60_11006362 [Bertholletia excelsa]
MLSNDVILKSPNAFSFNCLIALYEPQSKWIFLMHFWLDRPALRNGSIRTYSKSCLYQYQKTKVCSQLLSSGMDLHTACIWSLVTWCWT